MVNYLPRTDLPKVLLDALQDRTYQEELAAYFKSLDEDTQKLFKISTTTLAKPPRQRILYERHSHRVWVDPITNLRKLYGGLIHLLLEKYGGDGNFVEKRIGLNMEVGDTLVHFHGKPDWYGPNERKETDYKVTSVWSYICGDHAEHTAQLNANAYLLRKVLGYKVESLQNLYLFTDWRKGDARRHKDYPPEPVAVVESPVWSDEKCLKYINSRIFVHLRNNSRDDDALEHCSREERWQPEPLYQVVKLWPDGSPQKVSKFRDRDKAKCEEWIKENKGEYIIREKPGMPKKCMDWCEISKFCGQYKSEVKQFMEEENDEF
jgi:hypothetical protein